MVTNVIDVDREEDNATDVVNQIERLGVRQWGVIPPDMAEFKPSPEPTIQDLARRMPEAARSNRLHRARILRQAGNIGEAAKLEREARLIAKLAHLPVN